MLICISEVQAKQPKKSSDDDDDDEKEDDYEEWKQRILENAARAQANS